VNFSQLRNFASTELVFLITLGMVFLGVKYWKGQEWFKFAGTILMGGIFIILLTGGDVVAPVRWLLGLFGIQI